MGHRRAFLTEHTGGLALSRRGSRPNRDVGGGRHGVVPGVLGIAAFAPPLDGAGNSVKAQKALARIAARLDLGVFHPTHCIPASAEAATV